MAGRLFLTVMVMVCCISGCAPALSDADLAQRGYGYLLEKDYSRAESDLVKALQKNPNNPYALLNLGVVYERTGRKGAAKILYDMVVRINAENKALTSTDDTATGKTLKEIAIMNLEALENR